MTEPRSVFYIFIEVTQITFEFDEFSIDFSHCKIQFAVCLDLDLLYLDSGSLDFLNKFSNGIQTRAEPENKCKSCTFFPMACESATIGYRAGTS